jgi:hypothetical protein
VDAAATRRRIGIAPGELQKSAATTPHNLADHGTKRRRLDRQARPAPAGAQQERRHRRWHQVGASLLGQPQPPGPRARSARMARGAPPPPHATASRSFEASGGGGDHPEPYRLQLPVPARGRARESDLVELVARARARSTCHSYFGLVPLCGRPRTSRKSRSPPRPDLRDLRRQPGRGQVGLTGPHASNMNDSSYYIRAPAPTATPFSTTPHGENRCPRLLRHQLRAPPSDREQRAFDRNSEGDPAPTAAS